MRSTLVAVLLLLLPACAPTELPASSGPGSSLSDADVQSGRTEATSPTITSPTITTGAPVPGEPDASVGRSEVVRPEGFERTQAVVSTADGATCELCVWVADTAPKRSRGMMFVTDLGAAVAMAFVYPEPHTGTFWMKNTVLPLSIAFFAPDGAFLSSFDMEPCTEPTCPNYRTPDDFVTAIEVPQGGLAELGLVAGSTLELLDLPCDP